MTDPPDRVLSDEQIEHFLTRSYVVIKNAIPRETTEAWTQRAFDRLGYDRQDPSTWESPRIAMPRSGNLGGPAEEIAPRAWQAACELSGGADRIRSWGINDGFIVTLGPTDDAPWQPPSAEAPGWHKDGSHFVHFLDSPEQAILALVCWTDVEHQGGATFVACDSVPVVARYLAEHPEGVRPDQFPREQWIGQCHDFEEMTAQAGDIVLLHPFTLHAASRNVRRLPRIITNPPARLNEPMNFNRANREDYSPVERAILRGLGVDRLDFQITGKREAIDSKDAKKRREFAKAEAERARRKQATGT